jgi:hypothetical protein
MVGIPWGWTGERVRRELPGIDAIEEPLDRRCQGQDGPCGCRAVGERAGDERQVLDEAQDAELSGVRIEPQDGHQRQRDERHLRTDLRGALADPGVTDSNPHSPALRVGVVNRT